MELALKETEQILSKRLYATCSLCGHYEIPDISDSHPCCSYPCPAVCCYRSVLTNQVASSVSQSMTLVSPAETAEPIEMPFGLRIRVGSKNHVLAGGPDPIKWGLDPSMGKSIFEEGGRPTVTYRDALP